MAFFQEYEKLRFIGKGAFASVYKVRHLSLGYVRALKVSHEFIENENDKSWQTFINECKMLLRIGNGMHPNIVRIYQPRLIDNKAAVEMDYVEGVSLAEYVAKERFIPVEEVRRFAEQIVGALAYCHEDIYRFMMEAEADNLEPDPTDGRKYLITPAKEHELINKYSVIHNDLHSNNIIRRDYDGQYILLDFGLAIQDNHCVKSSSRGDGAIEYTAPEKLERNLVSKQSDVYSLGVLLYEMLTGQVPFPCKGETPEYARAKVVMQHFNETPPAIEPLRCQAFEATHPGEEYHDDLPAGLTDIVMKCLAKKPAERYADAKALQMALNACLAQESEPTVQQPIPPTPPTTDTELSGRESINSEAIRKALAEQAKRFEERLRELESRQQSGSLPDDEGGSEIKKNDDSKFKRIIRTLLVIAAIALGIFAMNKCNHERPAPAPEPIDVSDGYAVIAELVNTEMVFVEGGTFTMGATTEQGSDAWDYEKPMHEVTLSDYYIGKYEVTQQLWEYVMTYSGPCADGTTMSAYSSDPWLGNDPSSGFGKGDAYPAYYVSYNDIVDIFLPRLNRITGKEYSLPTEAEWEYAARGGNKSRRYKYSGSDNIDDVAWYGGNSDGRSHKVGTKQANELGIYDMSGNVWEWCSDWYGDYSSAAQTNPTGSASGSYRVYRGGYWGNYAHCCRVSNRYGNNPGYRYYYIGFRLACRQVN